MICGLLTRFLKDFLAILLGVKVNFVIVNGLEQTIIG
jgi:hypothetical protein